MVEKSEKWSDLSTRAISGIVIALFSFAMVMLGGVWFQMFAVFATAVMIWELWMMIRPDMPERGMLMAALSASVLSGLLVGDQALILLFFLITPVVGALSARRERVTFFLFALGIQVAGWGLILFRHDFGPVWVLWLLLVVIVTDLAGYFAGRYFGGPKFWPRVSPKKTWSGTVAGWIAAGFVGLFIDLFVPAAGLSIVLVSMALSFASQMGDIAESALKRRMGVKDSSDLIPGHGGLFDRFDGMLGATLFMLVLAVGFDVPGLVF